MVDACIEQLALADPELARCLGAALGRRATPLSPKAQQEMAAHILEGIALEPSFGGVIARGYADLVPICDADRLGLYRSRVREAGRTGPTLGRLMAGHLVPVLKGGDFALLDSFVQTTGIMLEKGTYTLSRPLALLDSLLDSGELGAAMAFLRLLAETFSLEMSYNRSLHLTAVLPKAVAGFPAASRPWQIEALGRVVRADRRLVAPFLDGMEKGLALLNREGLGRFINTGLERFRANRRRGGNFFALASVTAMDALDALQVSASLAGVAPRLNRYLQARTGSRLAVRPLSDLPDSLAPVPEAGVAACSDGRFIFLPETIGIEDCRPGNLEIYQCLARLESAYAEFDTFVFDFERVMGRCGRPVNRPVPLADRSDMALFYGQFENPSLAEALFTIAEHGRLYRCMAGRYPGMVGRIRTMMGNAADRFPDGAGRPCLNPVYDRIVLGRSPAGASGLWAEAVDVFKDRVEGSATVEDCALAVWTTYPVFVPLVKAGQRRLLALPFGRRLRPDLYRRAHARDGETASLLSRRLRDRGMVVYKADIEQRLQEAGGTLTPEDLRQMARRAADPGPGTRFGAPPCCLSPGELADLLGADCRPAAGMMEAAAGPVSWYREWDAGQNDYLDRHCRVVEKEIPPEGTADVFADTLGRHRGLVRRIRYAFELLRPEGLSILRQWTEGDEFDYRALLDFAMDRKAGRIPSDRLYVKRIKQQRDVAVLLLVDLSRSTANLANGGGERVLDVEKEAIVLFCEALSVVGDRFAIAGFSGSGRLGVDYFPIKDFDHPLDGAVRRRISNMAPRRSTRMGAAIRHAAARFDAVSAAVRLMIVLGDGFPNDVDYKRDYAIEDTRRAINESRSKNIFAHGITVNLAADNRLDDLYGNLHHNVIANVRELPDKLLRIYSALTR